MKSCTAHARRHLAATFLAFCAVTAHAQPSAVPDPNTWLNAAQQAVQLIDQNKAGELWEGGSAEMKKRVAKKDFVASVKKLRGVDAVTAREWVAIERSQLAARPDVPAGQYVNVRFRAALGKRAVAELVTFRQEADGGWRWMGYLVQ